MNKPITLKGRDLLRLADFSAANRYLLDLAAELKDAKRQGREAQQLVGKEIALSSRRLDPYAVRVRGAAFDQGAHVTFIGPSGSHMGHKETVRDTARVLGRMYDAIEYRGFAQQTAEGCPLLCRSTTV